MIVSDPLNVWESPCTLQCYKCSMSDLPRVGIRSCDILLTRHQKPSEFTEETQAEKPPKLLHNPGPPRVTTKSLTGAGVGRMKARMRWAGNSRHSNVFKYPHCPCLCQYRGDCFGHRDNLPSNWPLTPSVSPTS